MDDRSEPQWIMFIADTETRDKMLKFAGGSQWQVDPSTAAALILVGAAVRTPSPLESHLVPGIGGMSMPASQSV
jgi:hypothetical protein